MVMENNFAVAFTGHRSYNNEADAELKSQLEELYARGYRRFLCGMAWGFDLAAGLAVLELKAWYDDVELVAVEPYSGFRDLFFSGAAELYDKLLDAADERVTVCDQGSLLAFFRRNDYLVDNAAVVVAWWNHIPKGGTAYTIKRAFKLGRKVVNLCPPQQMELF